jgi:hypothetical protein
VGQESQKCQPPPSNCSVAQECLLMLHPGQPYPSPMMPLCS